MPSIQQLHWSATNVVQFMCKKGRDFESETGLSMG